MSVDDLRGGALIGLVALALGLGVAGGSVGAAHHPNGLLAVDAPVSTVTATAANGGAPRARGWVATIDGDPITLRAYKHWMYVAAEVQAAQENTEPAILPLWPPRFGSCVARIRLDVPSLANRSTATLRADCARQFTQLNNTVMSYLIEAYWYQADAYNIGIRYTATDLRNDVRKTIEREFPTAAKFRAYLKANGETKPDVRYQIRVSKIYAKLVKADTRATGLANQQRDVTKQVTQEFKASTICAPSYFVSRLCGDSKRIRPPFTTVPGVESVPSRGATSQPKPTKATHTLTVATPKTGPLSKEPVFSVPSGPPPRDLVVKDLVIGTGATAKKGDQLYVNFVGKLYSNGKIFDASWKDTPGKAFGPFELDAGSVIKGFVQGVAGMRVGGRRELIIPPNLAYGAAGSPPTIPKNATLVFVVDLLSVEK